MNGNSPKPQKQSSEKYLRDIEDTYIFDPASGLYRPKSYESAKEEKRKDRGLSFFTPLFVNPISDWITFASVTISFITLVVVICYTVASYGQWTEMIKATRAATNANQLADRGISQNLNASRLDQRAWLGLEIIKGTPDAPETGKPFDIAVGIRNSGKTPAKKVILQGDATPLGSPPHVNDICDVAIKKKESQSMLPPNGFYSINLHPTNGKALDPGWESSIKDKKLYAFG